MAVTLEFYRRRDDQPTPSRAELIGCIGALGLKAEASDVVGRQNEEDIVVNHLDGTFAIELFRQGSETWWCQRPNEAQLELFARIADAAGYDVEYDGGVSRWSNGEVVEIRPVPQEPFRIRGVHVSFAIMAMIVAYMLVQKLL